MRKNSSAPHRSGNMYYAPVPTYDGTRAAEFAAAARQRTEQRRKHRSRMLAVFYIFLFLVVIAVAVTLSFTVLFKITNVCVSGTSRYSEKQILDASGIKKGDNLFLIHTSASAEKIGQKLPYIGTVNVSRKFPTQVEISVKEEPVCGAAAFGNGYIVIGENGKTLECAKKCPQGCIVLKGLNINKAQPGFPVAFANSSRAEILRDVMDSVKKNGLSNITEADFSQPSRILLNYDRRVIINFGTSADIDYKLVFAKKLLKENIKSTEKGTLNMSVVSDTNKAYFDPDYGAGSSAPANK